MCLCVCLCVCVCVSVCVRPPVTRLLSVEFPMVGKVCVTERNDFHTNECHRSSEAPLTVFRVTRPAESRTLL